MDPRQIKKHIAGHGIWKVELAQALEDGGGALAPAEIRPDDRCAFGRWLREMPPSAQAGAHYGEVRELHRLFHLEAAEVVELIQRGERDEADRRIRMLGRFSRASSRLTKAMVAWIEARA